VEARVFEIARGLSRMGHASILIDKRHADNDLAVERIDGVKVVRIDATEFHARRMAGSKKVGSYWLMVEHVLNQLLFGFAISNYLREADFDIVNMHNAISALVVSVTCGSVKGRLVYSSHSARRSMVFPRLIDKMALMWEKLLVSRVDLLP